MVCFLPKNAQARKGDFFNGSNSSFGQVGDEQLQECLAEFVPGATMSLE